MKNDTITINGLRFKNKVMISPMCQYSSNNGCPSDWHYHHLRNLIETGAGSLVIESTAVSAKGRITKKDLCLFNKSHLREHKKLVKYLKTIKRIPIILQISHSGRKGSAEIPFKKKNKPLSKKLGWQTYAPSNLKRDKNWPKPVSMKKNQIKNLIKNFSHTSKLAFKAGYDGVEVHMAHGYLLHQFCSPVSNKREDEYGIKQVNHNLHKVIIKNIKNILPKKKVIGVRVTGSDNLPKGIKPTDCIQLLNILQKEGLNYACISSGGIIPKTRMKFYPGFRIRMAKLIKKKTKVLIRTSGLINNKDILTAAKKNLDFVALGRKLINDKYFLFEQKKFNSKQSLPEQYYYCFN